MCCEHIIARLWRGVGACTYCVVSKPSCRWSDRPGPAPSVDDVVDSRHWRQAAATPTPYRLSTVDRQVPAASPRHLAPRTSSRRRRRRAAGTRTRARRRCDVLVQRRAPRGGPHTVWRQRADADRRRRCPRPQQPSASACMSSRTVVGRSVVADWGGQFSGDDSCTLARVTEVQRGCSGVPVLADLSSSQSLRASERRRRRWAVQHVAACTGARRVLSAAAAGHPPLINTRHTPAQVIRCPRQRALRVLLREIREHFNAPPNHTLFSTYMISLESPHLFTTDAAIGLIMA